jgi:TRAP-type C4-dicarboxylate transport system substrate-binding protein
MATIAGCNKTEEPVAEKSAVTLTLAEMHVAEHPITKSLTYFAQEVESETNGRVIVDVYPASQLGSETDAIENVCSGELDMARVSAVTLSNKDEVLTPMALPYVFRSREHLWNTINSGIGDEMLSGMNNCVGLAWLESGSRCFFFGEPISSHSEMKGKRIRIPDSDVMNMLMAAYGAEPVYMDLSQVYSAMQKGEVDGAENDIISYYSFAGNLVADNYVMDHHNFAPSLIIASNHLKDKIGESDYDILLKCAKKAQAKSVDFWKESEDATIEELKSKGVNFIYPNEQQMAEFRSAAEGIWAKYPEYTDVIDKIQQIEG